MENSSQGPPAIHLTPLAFETPTAVLLYRTLCEVQ